jgi:hypothetical protein
VDQVFGSEEVTAGSGGGTQSSGTINWLLDNSDGSATDVAEYSGGSTSIVDSIVYDSFGQITYQSAPSLQPTFTYMGQQYFNFGNTGLYYEGNGSSWYDAVNGVFASQGGPGYNGSANNSFEYMGNNPNMSQSGIGFNTGDSASGAGISGSGGSAVPVAGGNQGGSYAFNIYIEVGSFGSGLESATGSGYAEQLPLAGNGGGGGIILLANALNTQHGIVRGGRFIEQDPDGKATGNYYWGDGWYELFEGQWVKNPQQDSPPLLPKGTVLSPHPPDPSQKPNVLPQLPTQQPSKRPDGEPTAREAYYQPPQPTGVPPPPGGYGYFDQFGTMWPNTKTPPTDAVPGVAITPGKKGKGNSSVQPEQPKWVPFNPWSPSTPPSFTIPPVIVNPFQPYPNGLLPTPPNGIPIYPNGGGNQIQ